MKNSIVIGITGGLGRAIAQMLVSNGYNVIGTYFSEDESDELFFKNNKITLHKLDIRSKKSVDSFIESIKTTERIDFITNTSSTPISINRFEATDIKTFEDDISANLTNHIYLLQRLMPKFAENSNIMFILTEYVFGEPPSYLSSYVISKYALLGLMKSMSVELKQKNIRINAVSPGMMDTKFISSLPKYVKENYANKSPLGRLVKPEEVANAIEHIIKDKTINGKNIAVFGDELSLWK